MICLVSCLISIGPGECSVFHLTLQFLSFQSLIRKGRREQWAPLNLAQLRPSGNKQSLTLKVESTLHHSLYDPRFFLTSGLLLYRAYYVDHWKSIGVTFEFLKLIHNHWWRYSRQITTCNIHNSLLLYLFSIQKSVSAGGLWVSGSTDSWHCPDQSDP